MNPLYNRPGEGQPSNKSDANTCDTKWFSSDREEKDNLYPSQELVRGPVCPQRLEGSTDSMEMLVKGVNSSGPKSSDGKITMQ